MKQPCLDCGTPTTDSRCQTCRTRFDGDKNRQQTGLRKSRGGRQQYGGGWARYAAAIRTSATICHLCGKGPKPDDPWQADHIIPAANGGGQGPAAAAHRSCNIARSNRGRTHPNQQPSTSPHLPAPTNRTAT